MLLSIIIPAYNEERFLEQSLARLSYALKENQQDGFSWEVIVCDNNSQDATADLARQSGAKVVFEPHNQIARARNRGAQAAQGDWFLFLDADSYPTPALLAETLTVLESPQVIGCGTTVRVEGGPLFNKLRMERLNPLFRLFKWSGGAYLLCRAEVFRTLGGFSTDLYALEEVDFVLRLKRYARRRGQQFVVLHRHPVISSGRKAAFQNFEIGRLLLSDYAAVFLFGLHCLLPKRWRARVDGRKLLAYWYRGRR